MALTDNLVAYWALDDATDSHAAYDLTGNGTISYAAGKNGNCFDNGSAGGNNYFTLDSHLGITATGAITIAGWTKFNTAISATNNPDWTVIRRYVDASGSGIGWIHEYNGGTPRLRFIRFGSTNYIGDHTFTPTVGEWFHAGVTFSGSEINCYLNGSLILGPTANSGTQNITEQKFVLGSYSGASSEEKYWAQDEFGIWSRVLSSTEFTELQTTFYPFTASSAVKSLNSLAKASVKSKNGLAIASIKSFNGLA